MPAAEGGALAWKKNDAVDEQHGVYAADLLSKGNSKYLTFKKYEIRPFMTVALRKEAAVYALAVSLPSTLTYQCYFMGH